MGFGREHEVGYLDPSITKSLLSGESNVLRRFIVFVTNTVTIIKLRMMVWARHVARVRQMCAKVRVRNMIKPLVLLVQTVKIEGSCEYIQCEKYKYREHYHNV